jgi:hypothetical protein
VPGVDRVRPVELPAELHPQGGNPVPDLLVL